MSFVLNLNKNWFFYETSVEDTDHDVSSADELESGLEHEDVGDVDEVAAVVGQQPQVDVLLGLVGKGPADRDQPHVPVPRRHHKEEPDDVDQIWGDGHTVLIRSTNRK